MSSLTLTLSGSGSDLSANYFPPIELEENAEYVCGLVDFQTFMSIPNVTVDNNRIYYAESYPLKLPAGAYHITFEIRELLIQQLKPGIRPPTIEEFHIEFERAIREGNIESERHASPHDLSALFDELEPEFKRNNIHVFKDKLKFVIEETPAELINKYLLSEEKEFIHFSVDTVISYMYKDYIELPIGSYEIVDIEQQINKIFKNFAIDCAVEIQVNKNTLKTQVKTNRTLYFDEKNSIASILGFNGDRILTYNANHESDFIIKISRVNVIKIECNIVEGAYSNGNAMHTLHEFYPTVGIGYKIVEVPKNVIYLPLTVRSIHNINIRIIDQNNRLIDFRGEPVSARLHIKKLK